MTELHHIETVTFETDSIFLKIDGKEITLPINKVSRKLESANETERNIFTISPSGYGIHWPLIDEDLSINSLLKVADINNSATQY